MPRCIPSSELLGRRSWAWAAEDRRTAAEGAEGRGAVPPLIEEQFCEDGSEASGHVGGEMTAGDGGVEGVTGGVTGLSAEPCEGDGTAGSRAKPDAAEVAQDFVGGHGVNSFF
jgi:hypothetical protein